MTLETLRTGYAKRTALVTLTGGSLLVLASRLATFPKTVWESDECLFVQAVARFDPLHHHPHPPGYPLLVGLGKAFNLVLGDPFTSLVALAVVSSLVGFLALALLFETCLEEGDAPGPGSAGAPAWGLAAAGAILFSFSPAMLVHSTLAMSDPPAVAFLALALWTASRVRDLSTAARAIAVGVLFSAAVGCRPQLVVAVLPTFAVVLLQMKGWRRRSLSMGSFAVASLAWLAPLVVAVGGPGGFLAWEAAQANVLATQDAALARAGWSLSAIVIRFVAHPWGPKWLAFPVLAAAAVGAVVLARRKVARVLPLAVAGAVHLVFCISFMDPADGARYALPALPAVALFATSGLKSAARWARVPALPAVIIAALCAGSLAYTWPILRARRTAPSPPVQAAREAASVVAPGGLVLVEPPLRPHAELLLRRFTTVPADAWWAEPRVVSGEALWLFADGRSVTKESRVAEWPPCDAYGKLTRNHYRVVSLAPISRAELYRPLRGFYQFERDETGLEWRWAGPEAILRLPNLGCGRLRLTLGLDRNAPFASNTVTVLLGDAPVGRLEVPRGSVRSVDVTDGGRALDLTLRSERSWVPAEQGSNPDTRRLAVEVIGVQQLCR